MSVDRDGDSVELPGCECPRDCPYADQVDQWRDDDVRLVTTKFECSGACDADWMLTTDKMATLGDYS